jgi:maltooligosyltrehalose trehalohydrolase
VVVEGRPEPVRLEPRPFGYRGGVANGVGPGKRYRYRLSEGREFPDPASRSQPDGVHGASEVVETYRFVWTDHGWRGLTLPNYVLYELHVGTFTREGTFDSVIPHLDELRDLGVTAIELMPVAQFSGTRNWGYDGVYPYAVQDSYGGGDGLKRLVDACHGRGLAVVLDVVHNHLGPEGNYLREFGPYFTDRYRTPWGDAMNVDGHGSDEVRRFFIESSMEWFEDYHVDALRLDAIHGIVDMSATPFLQELADRVRGLDLGRPRYLIAESDLGDPRVVKPPHVGGLGHDGHWVDDFHHALHVLLTGERNGYYQDFGAIEDLAVAFRDAYVLQGQYSTFRERRHGVPPDGVPAERFVVFTQNHDQVGNRLLGERLSELVDFDSLKLAAGCVLLSPFVPLLFMGEEYAELAPFQYFVSHSDPKLGHAVRRGRKAAFRSFGWKGKAPDPLDEATFERSKLDHSLKGKDEHRHLYELYRELLRLRRQLPALATLSREACSAEPSRSNERVLAVRRGDGDDQVAIFLNFGRSPAIEPRPAGRWWKVLDSSDAVWKGSGAAIPGLFEPEAPPDLTLQPRSFMVLRNRPEGARA